MHIVVILIKSVFNKNLKHLLSSSFRKRFMQIIHKKLYYDRIDDFECIDANRKAHPKNSLLVTICHYFVNKEFRFQLTACNGCHDILMMTIDISAIFFFKYS